MPFAIQQFVVDSPAVRPRGIADARLQTVRESGSYRAPLAGGYKAFATTFTAAPDVTIASKDIHNAPPRLQRITQGSFMASGSPGTHYIRYLAFGPVASG